MVVIRKGRREGIAKHGGGFAEVDPVLLEIR
jgi:hypothetical protein